MLEKVPPLHPSITVSEQCITDDLDRLLVLLPERLQVCLAASERRADLLEVVLDLKILEAVVELEDLEKVELLLVLIQLVH